MVLPVLGAIGGAAAGVGNLVSAFRGPQQQAYAGPGPDYASLYALQLAPGQTQLTAQAQESAALLGPYLAAMNTEAATVAGLTLGQFQQGALANEKIIGTQAALAQALGAAGISNLANQATARNQIQALGPSKKSEFASDYTKATAGLAGSLLSEEGKNIASLTQGLGSQALGAAQTRNKYVGDMGDMALYKVKSEIDTQKALNLLRGETEAQLAKKRFGAGLAMSAATGWA